VLSLFIVCTCSRLEKLLKDGTKEFGGESDKDDLYIAPTLITDVRNDDAIMKEEVRDTHSRAG